MAQIEIACLQPSGGMHEPRKEPVQGNVPPGTLPPGTVPPGTVSLGMVPPGTVPPGSVPPGTVPPGTEPPGTGPPGAVPPGTVPPDGLPPGKVPPAGVLSSPLESRLCSVGFRGSALWGASVAAMVSSHVREANSRCIPVLRRQHCSYAILIKSVIWTKLISCNGGRAWKPPVMEPQTWADLQPAVRLFMLL
jgi:hypothetical protein